VPESRLALPGIYLIASGRNPDSAAHGVSAGQQSHWDIERDCKAIQLCERHVSPSAGLDSSKGWLGELSTSSKLTLAEASALTFAADPLPHKLEIHVAPPS
jgi:hypothetical protein